MQSRSHKEILINLITQNFENINFPSSNGPYNLQCLCLRQLQFVIFFSYAARCSLCRQKKIWTYKQTLAYCRLGSAFCAFHLMCLGDCFVSVHIELPHFFQWLNCSPLYENAIIYLIRLLLKSIWVGSSLLLLCTTLQLIRWIHF